MYLPILTYHRLLAVNPDPTRDPQRIAVQVDRFRAHLKWLSRLGYRTLRLEDYTATLAEGKPVPARTFAITFDDAYEDVLTLGLPALKKFGFTATVFAVSGQVGGTNAWDDGAARLLSADQLRELQSAGITIGAHSAHHVHLSQVTLEEARTELLDSKRDLEKILGRPVTLLAYPYGESSPSVELAAEMAGYSAAFATDRAPADHTKNRFRLRRVVLFPGTNLWQLLWKVQTWYPRYQDWRRSTPVILRGSRRRNHE